MKSKKIKKPGSILFFLFLLSCMITPLTLSKYLGRTEGTGTKTSGIAYIEYNEEGENPLRLNLTDLDPNEQKEYHFTIKNYSSEKTNEVALNYQIQIESTNHLPLKMTLISKEDGQIEATHTFSGSEVEEFFSKDFVLPHTEKTIKNYILKIEWSEDASYLYQDLCDIITIRVNWDQKLQ